MVLKRANATGALPAMVRVPPGFTEDVSDCMQGTKIKLFAHHMLCACNVFTLKISHLISFTGPIGHVFAIRPGCRYCIPSFLGRKNGTFFRCPCWCSYIKFILMNVLVPVPGVLR